MSFYFLTALQVNSVLMNHYVQFFQTFPWAGSNYTFTGIDEKTRIVHRALD